MLTAIEHKPRPRPTALPYSPQHFQTAKLVKTIAGINDHRTVWLRFLLQKPFGLQCQKGPLSRPLPLLATIHLHLQYHLHINRYLSFCYFTVTPPSPSRLLFFLCLLYRLCLSTYFVPILPSLTNDMSESLCDGVKACAQLEIPKYCL